MLDRDRENLEMNKEKANPMLEEVRKWLEEVKFNKQLLGGLSEVDVWKKIEELNSIYEQALRAEQIRYEALLEEYKKDKITTRTEDSL